jgi:hypothetical protein
MKMCQDSESEQNDTNRVLLQIYHDRNNQLSNMLITLNGFILAFVSGIIAFMGSTFFSTTECFVIINSRVSILDSCNQNKVVPIIIGINVLIGVLILWRCFAHYIDDDIVSGYCNIIRCEEKLSVDKRLKLLCKLEKVEGTLKLDSLGSYRDKPFKTKIEIIEQLSRCKKMGYRGHYWFNVITIFTITALLISEAVLLRFLNIDDITLFIMGILGLLLTIMVFFYCGLCNLKFLSLENKNSLYKSLLMMFLLSCAAITLLFLFSLNAEFLKDLMWTVYFFAVKDIGIFVLLVYLVFCYAQSDPTNSDIEKITNPHNQDC